MAHPLNAQATPLKIETFLLNGKKIQLLHDKASHLLISTECWVQKEGKIKMNENCEAMRKLKTYSLKDSISSLPGGADPGAVICAKEGGLVFIALDKKHNQYCLCQFSDHSMISSGTIHFHALLNDSNQRKKPVFSASRKNHSSKKFIPSF